MYLSSITAALPTTAVGGRQSPKGHITAMAERAIIGSSPFILKRSIRGTPSRGATAYCTNPSDQGKMSQRVAYNVVRGRVIYHVESGVEQIVKYKEPSKELNQVELMKQWIGTWKCNVAKDTTAVWVETSYGTGLEGIYKFSTKGKTYMEGKEFAGYDKRSDKYIAAQMFKGKDIEIYALWFTSKNKCILLPFSNISNPEAASFKTESTFVSPDTEIDTIFINNKPVKTETWTKVR